MIRKKYIRIVTTLFIGGFLAAQVSAMEQGAQQLTNTQLQTIQAEAAQAIQEMNQNGTTIETILQEMAQDEAQYAAPFNTGIPQIDELTQQAGILLPAIPNFEKDRQRAQNQNTVLLGHPKVPVALYKRDLYELPFFAADLAIAYAGFHVYKQYRIEHLYKILTTHTETTIEELEKIQSLQKQIESKSLDAAQQETTQKELDTLWEKFGEQHAYIGYNPFKLDMLLPLIGTMIGHAASSYAQSKIILKNSFVPEAQFAYTKKADGSYERFELDRMYTPTIDDYKKLFDTNQKHNHNDVATALKTAATFYGYVGLSSVFWSKSPFAAMTALRLFIIHNPNTPITDNMPDIGPLIPDEAIEKGWYKITGLPDWLYTVKNAPATRYVMEAIILGRILILIDRAYHGAWIKHVQTNTNELITLLKQYQATHELSNKNPDKQHAQKQLKDFIATGTTITSWRTACHDLFVHKVMGRASVQVRVVSWLTTAISASLLWKSRTPIKFIYNGAKTGIISTEALLIGGLITAYYGGILFGPIVAQSAYIVYQDIKHVAQSIKNYVLKNWQSKKEDPAIVATDQEKINNVSVTN